MPTKFMRLGFDEQVLRRLANETENGAPVGYVLDVGLNYYRGTPISAVERLELTVDGERVDDDRILVEVDGTFLRIPQVPPGLHRVLGRAHAHQAPCRRRAPGRR